LLSKCCFSCICVLRTEIKPVKLIIAQSVGCMQFLLYHGHTIHAQKKALLCAMGGFLLTLFLVACLSWFSPCIICPLFEDVTTRRVIDNTSHVFLFLFGCIRGFIVVLFAPHLICFVLFFIALCLNGLILRFLINDSNK